MNKLPYLAFLIVFLIPFFSRGLGILPGPTVLLFELMSGFILVSALAYGAVYKIFNVGPKYIGLFIVVCLHFIAGAVLNSLDPAVIFSGLRTYLKYTPLFLLPLVYVYSEQQMTGQLKFLVVLGILQLPLVLVQFFILGWHEDLVAGTLVIGSILSIFLVSSIAVLTAFYFRELISGRVYLSLALLLFIPATLNESKGTILLLVLGLIVIMLGARIKRSQIIMAMGALTIMLSSFVVIYNIYFDSVAGTGGFVEFFTTDPDRGITHYLYSGDSVEIDPDAVLEPASSLPGALPSLDPEEYRTRRIDSLLLPLRVLSDDPARLLLGVGIGNASKSMGRMFSGEYSFLEEYRIFGNALSRFLWEIGVLGTFLYLVFLLIIFRDARRLAQAGGVSGALALGWTGVIAIVVLSLPYKNIFIFEAFSAIFWYLSGHIAARAYTLRISQAVPSPLLTTRMINQSTLNHGRQ